MAGTAKGTVPSPLSSGTYIRLTGTSHFHRYYGAIRLPTTRLFPSFHRVHIPRFTRFRGRCRLSPVDIVALYSMNRSLTPPMQSRPRPIGHDCVAFHQIESVGHRVCLCFGVQYCPYCLTSHALRPMLPLSAQGLLLVAWLMPFQAGFPPACYAILCWAHQFQKISPIFLTNKCPDQLELSVAFIIFALRLDDACKCHTYYDNSCSSNASWR